MGITLQPLTTGDLVKAPFSMIGQMLTMPFFILKAWLSQQYTGSEIVSNLQGPVGIMQILFLLSDNGIAQFLYFVALLNAAIGAFNLLPFPALDGSRLVFLIIAGLRGHTTGYAVPQYVIDAPGGGGKVPVNPDYVERITDDEVVFRNFEGEQFRYPLKATPVPATAGQVMPAEIHL